MNAHELGAECLSDICWQETDSFDWVLDKLPEVQFNCLETAVQAINLTSSIANVTSSNAVRFEAVLTLIEVVTVQLCPLQCNTQGQCVDGECVCDTGEGPLHSFSHFLFV